MYAALFQLCIQQHIFSTAMIRLYNQKSTETGIKTFYFHQVSCWFFRASCVNEKNLSNDRDLLQK